MSHGTKKSSESRHFSSQQHGRSFTLYQELINQSTNQSTKKVVRNKENMNMFNEISSLLQYYQSSSVLKKKTSLPTSMISPKKLIDELILKHAYHPKKQSRNKVSVSQNIGQKNLSLSPIQAKQKGKQSSHGHRCHYHPNKKAHYFEYERSAGAIFYCDDCSMNKFFNGFLLQSIDQYGVVKQNSNKKRENQSVSRANFWSVDENSLLSNSPFLLESENFTCSTDESEDKSKELREFQQSVTSLQDECEQIIQNSTSNNSQQQKYNTINTELQQILYMINTQSMKMLQQLQSQPQLQVVKDVQNELDSIQQDIRAHEHNILNNMQLRPFKMIIQKYKEKMKQYVQTINNCQQNQLLFDLQDRYDRLLKIKKLLKTQFKLEEEEQELLSTRRKLTSNVYISFENKEMFLAAAQRASMNVKDDPELVQIGDKGHLLESPNFIQN